MKLIAIEDNVYRITNAEYEKLNELCELNSSFHLKHFLTKKEQEEKSRFSRFMEKIEKTHSIFCVLDERYGY